MTGEGEGVPGERRDRYLEKLDRIRIRTDEIEEWSQPGVEVLLGRSRDRLAIYKAFQEAVEAAMDLCAMFLVDEDMSVGDDYENVERASGRLFPSELDRGLKNANGLRNRVIHEYNKFEEDRALEGIAEKAGTLRAFEREARKWIKER